MQFSFYYPALCLFLISGGSMAFSPSNGSLIRRFPVHATTASTALRTMIPEHQENDDGESKAASLSPIFPNRRALLHKTAALVTSATFVPFASFPEISLAAEEGETLAMGTDASHPITVLGAGGKCGNLCADILASKKNLYTRAVTRSGRETLSKESKYVSYAKGDVTNYESVKNAVEGSSGVIFAASASGKKKGGDPAHVDYLGLYNTAKACLECGVSKLVVISAATVTRPDSAGFKATNFFVKYVYGDKIMDYKIAGESIMRDLYAEQAADKQNYKSAYCVVRPGGLSDKPSAGSSAIHLSQGDVYADEISREDVAEVTVAALLAGVNTDFVTFEANSIKGLMKALDNLESLPPSLVHAGASTFEEFFTQPFTTDAMMKESFRQYYSDFKGNNIEPVGTLA